MFLIEEELKKLPGKPGVYIMHGEKDEIIYVSDHLLNLCAFIAAALEILADTVLQTDCLSHINDLIFFPMQKD